MKKALLVLALLFTATISEAQYNAQEPREDYAQAFEGRLNDFAWKRQCSTDKDRAMLIEQISKRIRITTVVDNIIIGELEDWWPGTYATMDNGRLPWDGSTIKANVCYVLNDGGYTVTVSRIYYLNEALDKAYCSAYQIIYNKYGELRKRGDTDLQYFDNAFCDLFLFD